MPYPMIIPQYSPVMMAGGGFAAAQPPMMPVAKALANQGRMTDSTLVHMNPQEVAGLQSLARQNGTSLTINPQTGLPEAFNLRGLLPMAAGAALTPVMGPGGAALVVGGLGTLATGSLEQGLMMGLGAMGGAQMAGSAANLAAPAADVTAAATSSAEFAAQQAAAHAAAQQAAVQQATAMNLPAGAPTDVFGNVLGIDEMAIAGGQGVSAGLPANTSFISKPPMSGIGRLFQPDDNVTYENIGSGLKKAFSSGDSAMDFLGQNKMNLAMSAAPMLITPEQEEADDRNRAMIRPYEYQVDNLSGTDVDPFGTEAERLRGRFVAKTPYYAAKGGLMSLAEGGSVSEGGASSAESSQAQTLTPSQAEVFRNIFAVQQLAGMPMGMTNSAPVGIAALPNPFTFPSVAPRPPVAYTPSVVGTSSALDTSERRYTGTPSTSVVVGEESPNVIEPNPNEIKFIPDFVNDALNKINRIVKAPPGGLAAEPRSSSLPSYSYDPATGTYTKLSSRQFSTGGYTRFAGGGLTALKAGGRAGRKKISRSDPFYEFGLDLGKVAEEQFAAGGLKEGAFIVPADVISHLGNGSSEAGMKIVQERLKGRPIKGPGDGMSDSIPTTIAGKQPARVANEEAEIPPEVVAALGGGSLEKGAKKLYEMMDKIRKDRTGKKKQAPAVKAEKYVPA